MEKISGSYCYVDLLVKEKKQEEEGNGDHDLLHDDHDHEAMVISPPSVLPSTNYSDETELRFFHGGKGVITDAMSLSPVIPGWYADASSQVPGEVRFYEVEKVLFHGKSKYQELLVFQSKEHGKVAILDGGLQLTERDEFAYQEMLTHLNLCSIPNPKKVLLIGGGDGGILREISRHASVEQIDICELDQMIIDTYKKFFPDIAVGYKDPRVRVYIDDGVAFLKKVPEGMYDAIVIDAFVEMGKGAIELADEDVLRSIAKALRPGGVLSAPGVPMWHKNFQMEETFARCRRIFGGSVDYAWTSVPSYNHGSIGFMLCSTKGPKVDFKNPVNPIGQGDLGAAKRPVKFYNSEMHAAAFCLPSFAKRMIGAEVD